LADRRGNNFNICDFVVQVLAKSFRRKGKLQIEFYDPEDLPEQACVTFDSLTLHIVKRIWDDAAAGRPYARFIVAHEIGHIVLHDRTAAAFPMTKMPFSNSSRRRNRPKSRQMLSPTCS